MKLEVEAVVLCDEVRQEISGKHIIIGAFGGTVGVRSLPHNLRSTWWVQLRGDKGTHKFKFRIMGPNNLQLVEGDVEITLASALGVIVMSNLQVQLQSEGTLRLEWKVGDGDWRLMKEVSITVGPSPLRITRAPSVSAPPSSQPPTAS